ncbi:MAG: helix-turn-helix domain-containing protein, partial [Cyanobacteriota bacterium]|nr:helix-turn-helix domain-containing protein [Cyanobacteriota bacterium]
AKKTVSAKAANKTVDKLKQDIVNEVKTGDVVRDEVRVVFKKALTDREQRVFDYFNSHKNQVVYAKELADLLQLPRDYVYKYIKNLRAKIEGEELQNADKGGFILSIK